MDDISSAALRNQPQEKTALLGKIITYDKHIKARNPKAGEQNITLYFDFEFQNEYRKTTLGYPLLKRGWFYAARELDSQLGVLTEDTKYSTLQKSYSIWICNEDIPKEEQNSMTRYHIVKDDVIGHSEDVPENYDLMEVIMIRRGDAEIDAEILALQAKIWAVENREIETAYEYAMNLVKRNPSDVFAWDVLGRVVAAREGDEAALELIERVGEVAKDCSSLFENLGDLYARTGNEKMARDAYLRAIELSDDGLVVVPQIRQKLRKVK